MKDAQAVRAARKTASIKTVDSEIGASEIVLLRFVGDMSDVFLRLFCGSLQNAKFVIGVKYLT